MRANVFQGFVFREEPSSMRLSHNVFPMIRVGDDICSGSCVGDGMSEFAVRGSFVNDCVCSGTMPNDGSPARNSDPVCWQIVFSKAGAWRGHVIRELDLLWNL